MHTSLPPLTSTPLRIRFPWHARLPFHSPDRGPRATGVRPQVTLKASLNVESAGAQRTVNDKVYALFELTAKEIVLIERETRHALRDT